MERDAKEKFSKLGYAKQGLLIDLNFVSSDVSVDSYNSWFCLWQRALLFSICALRAHFSDSGIFME
jgi:hypothetical protein